MSAVHPLVFVVLVQPIIIQVLMEVAFSVPSTNAKPVFLTLSVVVAIKDSVLVVQVLVLLAIFRIARSVLSMVFALSAILLITLHLTPLLASNVISEIAWLALLIWSVKLVQADSHLTQLEVAATHVMLTTVLSVMDQLNALYVVQAISSIQLQSVFLVALLTVLHVLVSTSVLHVCLDLC